MPEIAFHFNAPDKIGHACRLLRKAVGAGARVIVTGSDLLLCELDAQLWTFSPLDFLPHARCEAPTSAPAATPILLMATPQAVEGFTVLVNLADSPPSAFERFERVIEVVTTDDADRAQARRRWKFYADKGHSITRHDLAGASA